MSRQVFPQAPSPTMTNFFLIAAITAAKHRKAEVTTWKHLIRNNWGMYVIAFRHCAATTTNNPVRTYEPPVTFSFVDTVPDARTVWNQHPGRTIFLSASISTPRLYIVGQLTMSCLYREYIWTLKRAKGPHFFSVILVWVVVGTFFHDDTFPLQYFWPAPVSTWILHVCPSSPLQYYLNLIKVNAFMAAASKKTWIAAVLTDLGFS